MLNFVNFFYMVIRKSVPTYNVNSLILIDNVILVETEYKSINVNTKQVIIILIDKKRRDK